MRPILSMLILVLMGNATFAQSILEQFEDETNNTTSFTANGNAFTINGGHLTITNVGGTYGVGPSVIYIDNNASLISSAGYIGSIYTSSKQDFIVDSIYLFPSTDGVTLNSTGGSEVMVGYKNGVLVGTSTTSVFNSTVTGRDNGFTKVATPFGTNAIDSIAFSCTGTLRYVAIDQFVFRKVSNTWTGGTSSVWSNTANWNDNAVPGTRDDIIIPGSLSNYPTISSGTVSCRNLTINSGGSLTVNGGTLQVSGSITNNGTLTATNGTIVLNDASYIGYANLNAVTSSTISPSAQTISGNAFSGNTIQNLTLNNTAGATISSTLNITDTYTPTAGSLTTGGFLTLKSTASGTARVAAGSSAGGYISGGVTIERYIPGGKRALRFLAHPFTTSQPLSSLTDDIDITGSGGSTNGFTTVTNNPASAYWFNVATADNTPSKANPGWTDITSTNGAGNNAWTQYGGVSVLCRGTIGQGLGTPVTPNAVTLDVTGSQLNQGTQTVTVTKGSGSTLVLIGNPYPSQTNLNLTTRGANIGSSFYTWDPYNGTKGGYITNSFSASYILPAYAAFLVTTAANTSNTITFHESDKTSSVATSLFKTTGNLANGVLLKLYSGADNIQWDQLRLYFDNQGSSDSDWYDAIKLYNPELNFYSFSDNKTQLAIDVRPFEENKKIQLGLVYAPLKTYTLKAEELEIPVGTHLYLHDKYLENVVELQQGSKYVFDVTGDPLSQGNARFELNTMGIATSNNIVVKDKLKVKLVPNPATNMVTVFYEGLSNENVNVTVRNMVGISVAEIQERSNQNGNIQIPLQSLPNGVYIVTLQNGNQTVTQRLVKQ